MANEPPRGRGPGTPPAAGLRPAQGEPASERGAGDLPIPMLTEIVLVPRQEVEPTPAALDQVDWAALARKVEDSVSARLAHRAQNLLDTALRDALDAAVNRAAESLAADLRTALSQTVKEIVARAVNEEITRVHLEMTHPPKT